MFHLSQTVPADRLRWGDGAEDEDDVQCMLCMYPVNSFDDGC